MRRAWPSVALALTGCANLFGLEAPVVVADDARPVDGARTDANNLDASRDAADGPAAAFGFVREAHAEHSDATHDSISVQVTPQDAGDLTIVVVSWYTPAVGLISLADSAGTSYSGAGEATDGTITQQLYFAPSPNAIANSITATFSGNAEFCELRVLEYKGLATNNPLDGTMTSSGSSTTEAVGPLATTHAHDLLLGIFTGSATAAGAGYTQRILFLGDLVEDREVTAAGSYMATAPAGASSWAATLAAFRMTN